MGNWGMKVPRTNLRIIAEAFIDYETRVTDYYFAQGFLGAAGDLLGQTVKPADLVKIYKRDGQKELERRVLAC